MSLKNINDISRSFSNELINRSPKSISMVKDSIEKSFGKGSIMLMGGGNSAIDISAIPTGSFSLDVATGIGGIPKGRVTEIYGPEASGKTTLTLHLIAECQKLGGNCAFIDAEHALDPIYAESLGVNLDSLLISQPDSGEQALGIAEELIQTNNVDLIIIDSVAALVPRAELEGDMGDSHVALQARLMSQALRKITREVSKSNTALVFINQIRMKIGVMFGNPETTTGGNALKFYSSMRLDIRSSGAIKTGDEKIGNRTKVKVVKNKVASPFKIAEFDLIFGKGISRVGDIIDYGISLGILDRSGTWFSFNDERLGQGRERVRLALESNPELVTRIESEIMDVLEENLREKIRLNQEIKKGKKKKPQKKERANSTPKNSDAIRNIIGSKRK